MSPEKLEEVKDEEVREAVESALLADSRTACLELRVGVLNGVVHLAGRAPSQDMWILVGETAARAPGVRGVVNRIQAPGAPNPSRTIHLDLGSISDRSG